MKDGHRIQVGTVEYEDGRIVLSGEFDLRVRQALREVLRATHRRGRRVLLDLSGVTFMDVGCAKELAFWCLLDPELLVPLDPSWQARASAVACDLGGERHLRVGEDAGTGSGPWPV
ncbi:STAS domain-containing protein [Rubrobacter tropicus]|uniref:STAS domain-containing protein n=1 Tax=Rubrobacter tropicus TaxID=2653851 RepID=UPI00140E4C4F|nr:STAS domain-containing protein [Rubrobacter tropicus]